jgi:glycosyltransferase involved in cell wall biosynthesis
MSAPYKYYKYNSEPITYSVVIPVYNQEAIFVDNLKSVLENTRQSFEVIIILDFCFDKTEALLLAFLDSYAPVANLVQITIFKNEVVPLFETKCDNIGFRHAQGKFCLEIQADMRMTEAGYNLQLARPFAALNNVIAVSGRCAHNMFTGGGIGKMGTKVETPVAQLGVSRDSFYIYETCNRGPLLIDRQKLAELGYLDEESYFLDDSDHDLMARAYLEKGYICGYVPIDFESPFRHGSTRNYNTYQFCKEFQINLMEKRRLLAQKGIGLNKYADRWLLRAPIVYDL